MPSPWEFNVEDSDIEEDPPPLQSGQERTFDGEWKATTLVNNQPRRTTVTISGSNVWHRGSLYATFRLVNNSTGVIVTKDADVKGFLSDDASTIDWDDGDCWPRVVQVVTDASSGMNPQDCEAVPEAVDSGSSEQETEEARRESMFSADDATAALLSRDQKKFMDILDDGVLVDTAVDPEAIWREMRWEPKWSGDSPRTPLLVAAILLQWPEGVEVCVRHGADVNGTYAGPFRCADGRAGHEAAGAHVLRVALSAQGPAQCTICQHLLHGKVSRRTFQMVRKRAKAEMDFVTAGFFDRYPGPYLEDQ